MTPHDLIAAFEVLAEAPEGVTRLQELVLELAVRGKLVPQDPEDEPASVLLKCIATEKARLAKEGRISKPKALPPVSMDEVPFDLPEGWEWARIEDLCAHVTDGVHKTPTYVETGVPFLSIKDISDGRLDFTNTRLIPEAEHAQINARCNPERGDVLFCRIGTLGRAVVVDTDRPFSLFVSVGLIKLAGHLDPHFLRMALNSPASYSQYDRIKAGGSHTDKLNLGAMRSAIMPVPPLAEQHRIVARVDELTGLLDRLEAARNTREGSRTALRDSALAALRDADTHDEAEAAWQRIAERMDDLFTDPTDVDPLRQAVLQLAVRGRLVPQDPEDEAARAFLGSRVKVVRPDDELFDLPPGWSWSSVERLGETRGGGTPSKDNPAFWGGSIPWVSPKDMKRDSIGQSQDYITPAALDGSAVKVVPSASLLMVVRGMILAHSFPTALTTAEVTVNQDMKALLPFRTDLGPYLLIVTKGLKPEIVALVERSTHGTCKLSTDKLSALPLPIPPLAEQQRIVARVDELMSLLDRLEQHLVAKHNTHEAFAAAAVHNLDA